MMKAVRARNRNERYEKILFNIVPRSNEFGDYRTKIQPFTRFIQYELRKIVKMARITQ